MFGHVDPALGYLVFRPLAASGNCTLINGIPISSQARGAEVEKLRAQGLLAPLSTAIDEHCVLEAVTVPSAPVMAAGSKISSSSNSSNGTAHQSASASAPKQQHAACSSSSGSSNDNHKIATQPAANPAAVRQQQCSQEHSSTAARILPMMSAAFSIMLLCFLGLFGVLLELPGGSYLARLLEALL